MRWSAAVGVGLAGWVSAAAAATDGTLGQVGSPDPGSPLYPANPRHLPQSTILLNPIDSVSMTASQVWRDNRHRAYQNPGQGVEDLTGFLLFDVSAIPDGAWISEMRLLCHLEDGYASPFGSPLVDVHYSSNDRWRRGTVAAGALTIGPLLLDDVAFDAFVPTHEFVLQSVLHDWSSDLQDNYITLAFRNDAPRYSFVYFFGAGGTPEGPPPELHVQYQQAISRPPSAWSAVKALYR